MAIIKRLKQLFKGNTEKTSTTTMQSEEDTSIVTYVNKFKADLNHLIYKYDTNLADIQGKYNSKQAEYEKRYQSYSDVFQKYQLKMASEEVLQEEKKLLEDAEGVLQEQGKLIDDVQGYKAEDVKAYSDKLESLKDEYTDELAGKIYTKAYRLQQMKSEYLNTLKDIQGLYQDASEVEKVLNNNIQFKSNVSEMLQIKTESVPLSTTDLQLNNQVIMEHLKKPNTVK